MASPTDTKFAAYAGQEVAGGSSTTPYNQPTIDFGDYVNANTIANMAPINSLMPKVGRVIVHDTMVYEAGIMIGALACAAGAFAALIYGFSRDPKAERDYSFKQKQQQIKRKKR